MVLPLLSFRLHLLPFSRLPLNSDENEVSLNIITTCSNIQLMRIKKVITKGKMSWYLDKFSLLVHKNSWRTVRRICIFISGFKRVTHSHDHPIGGRVPLYKEVILRQ